MKFVYFLDLREDEVQYKVLHVKGLDNHKDCILSLNIM